MLATTSDLKTWRNVTVELRALNFTSTLLFMVTFV